MVVYQRVAVFVLLVKCMFLFGESWEIVWSLFGDCWHVMSDALK